jgi:hypothetical protein
MLPTIDVIYFVQNALLVQNKNENVKCPELPCSTVPFSDWLKFSKHQFFIII